MIVRPTSTSFLTISISEASGDRDGGLEIPDGELEFVASRSGGPADKM
jgi:hypothetical protein